MSFFVPSLFLYQFQSLPEKMVDHLDQIDMDASSLSLSTCFLAILVIMSTVECVALVLCTIYSLFPRIFDDWAWDTGDNFEESEESRQDRIESSLIESCWGLRQFEPAECPICLCDFELNDAVVVSKSTKANCCQHVFHKGCLCQWLERQSTCPCCREELLTPPVLQPKDNHTNPNFCFSFLACPRYEM